MIALESSVLAVKWLDQSRCVPKMASQSVPPAIGEYESANREVKVIQALGRCYACYEWQRPAKMPSPI